MPKHNLNIILLIVIIIMLGLIIPINEIFLKICFILTIITFAINVLNVTQFNSFVSKQVFFRKSEQTTQNVELFSSHESLNTPVSKIYNPSTTFENLFKMSAVLSTYSILFAVLGNSMFSQELISIGLLCAIVMNIYIFTITFINFKTTKHAIKFGYIK